MLAHKSLQFYEIFVKVRWNVMALLYSKNYRKLLVWDTALER